MRCDVLKTVCCSCLLRTGQSFLLNQIRKMVGLACEAVRAAQPHESVRHAMETADRVSLTGLFVYLHCCYAAVSISCEHDVISLLCTIHPR